MAMKLIPGKVYLRDVRNNNVYEYEANLAGMSYIKAFTQEESEAEPAAAAPVESTAPVVEPTPEAPVVPKPPVKPQAQPAKKVVTKVVAKKAVAPKPTK